MLVTFVIIIIELLYTYDILCACMQVSTYTDRHIANLNGNSFSIQKTGFTNP